jgi:hypothetical protein
MSERTKLGRKLLRLHRTVRALASDEATELLACELYYSGANGLDAPWAREKLIEAIERISRGQLPDV